MESGRLIDIYGDCSDEEEVPLNGPTGEEQRKLWDPFRTMPPKDTTGSLANAATVEAFSQIAKVIAYIVTFCIFLTGAVIAKGTLLFMTSQIKITDKKPDVQHPYCSTRAGREIEASVSMEERVGWVWAIFFCFVVPEFFMWFRSTRICLFRTWKRPTTREFFIIQAKDPNADIYPSFRRTGGPRITHPPSSHLRRGRKKMVDQKIIFFVKFFVFAFLRILYCVDLNPAEPPLLFANFSSS